MIMLIDLLVLIPVFVLFLAFLLIEIHETKILRDLDKLENEYLRKADESYNKQMRLLDEYEKNLRFNYKKVLTRLVPK